MAKRPCYGCEEDLDALRDRRNEEIRAWGRQVLADADAALLKEPSNNNHHSDWDNLDVEPDLEVVSEISTNEPEPTQPEPEISTPEPNSAPSPEPLKTAPKPKGAKTPSS